MTLKGHDNDINAITLFRDGYTFASGGDDSTIRVFDMRSVAEIKCFKSDNILCGVTSLDASKSGRFLFGGYDDYNCYKWDLLGSGQKVAQVMSGHENRVSCGRQPPGQRRLHRQLGRQPQNLGLGRQI